MSGIRGIVAARLSALLAVVISITPAVAQQPEIYLGKPRRGDAPKREPVNRLAQCLADPADRSSCQAAAGAFTGGGFEAGDIGTSIYFNCGETGRICLEVGTLIFGKNARLKSSADPTRDKQRLPSIDIRILFDHDADELRGSEALKLRDLAAALDHRLNLKKRFAVIGHTDGRGTTEYNCKLSARRAMSVRKHLVGLGISSDRLVTFGVGEYLPRNQLKRTAPENRRVAFVRMPLQGSRLLERMADLCATPRKRSK